MNDDRLSLLIAKYLRECTMDIEDVTRAVTKNNVGYLAITTTDQRKFTVTITED